MRKIFRKITKRLAILNKKPIVSKQKANVFSRYEKSLLARIEPWLAELVVSGEHSEETLKKDETSLVIICMTPRSGSSALSAALAQCEALGIGGERLSQRKGGPLYGTMMRHNSKSPSGLLDAVISEACSSNGVSQIKCDLPQLLPFLMDPASFDRIRHAKFVYLTRQDILDQAISRYKGFQTGYWHSRKGDAPTTDAKIPYDFDGIRNQVITITNMMSAYERIFAVLGIVPYRITYEQIVTNCADVIQNIAQLVDVEIGADISLNSGGHAKIANSQSRQFKERFRKEFSEL